MDLGRIETADSFAGNQNIKIKIEEFLENCNGMFSLLLEHTIKVNSVLSFLTTQISAFHL